MGRSVVFPYERVFTPIGFIWVPVARVELAHGRKRFELDMIVDTGADLTMIPYQVGFNLGMRRGGASLATLAGISGRTPYLLKKADLRIGPIRLFGRIAWAQREDVPMLLGRIDVLDRLIVTLDGRRRSVSFRT